MTTYVCNPKTGRAIKVVGVTYKKINKNSKWKRKLARFPKRSSKKMACQVCGINEKTNRCNRNFSHNQPHLCKLGPKGYCRKKNLRDKIKLESIVEDDEEKKDDELFLEEVEILSPKEKKDDEDEDKDELSPKEKKDDEDEEKEE